ncbi:gp53-like domain-containing protein [Sphingomonas sp. BK069]|uniref:gp53-like domain-containing protein n=1 Tax=Sphingomonas sp. BK069 TaxID=2586979 RepID=UPI00160F70DA|nr:hypothetical protein [Sphingomonas sp. BK069]MBB3346037.1 hypothetical protein [Sphingomonas sp. BK069]
MGVQLVITDAGRAAVLDQANGGFRAVRVETVGFSASALVASPTTVTLPDEVKRVGTLSGEATAPDTLHLTVTDDSEDSYTVRSFALYLSDGTLFALYGQPGVIVEKSSQALLLLALDVELVDLPATAITFGDARFSNPAATTRRAGVVTLATQEQASAGDDTRSALTPATAKGAVLAWLGYTPVQQGTGAGQYPNTVKIGWSGSRLLGTVDTTDQGAFVFERGGDMVWRVNNDGAGSGLDADLLDGFDSSYFLDVANRLGFTPVQQGTGAGQYPNTVKIGWSGSRLLGTVDTSDQGAFVFERGGDTVWRVDNDGAGSGLDADLLDGLDSSYFTDVVGRLGFTPVQQGTGYYQSSNTVKIGWSGSGLLATVDNGHLGAFVFERGGDAVWRVNNDGAGSGLDADLLDGLDSSYFLDVAGRLGFTPVQQGTGVGQTANTVKIGWSDHGLLATVDATDHGAFVFERGGDTVWRVNNDGAGSGLDADLVDGLHADQLRDWNNLLNRPKVFPPAGHTHGAADIAGAFRGSLTENGYTVLPNGLILQWMTGGEDGDAGMIGREMLFPIAFPSACLIALVTTKAKEVEKDMLMIYSVLTVATDRIRFARQLVGTDSNASVGNAYVVALGH